jgi:hypothetical protein
VKKKKEELQVSAFVVNKLTISLETVPMTLELVAGVVLRMLIGALKSISNTSSRPRVRIKSPKLFGVKQQTSGYLQLGKT